MSDYDIRNATFEQFVLFLFDHPVAKENEEPWYWTYQRVRYDVDRNNEFYTKLFSAPKFLLGQFTLDQLEQGFWAIQSCNLEGAVYETMWCSEIPFEKRAACVRSMYYLYKDLFAIEPLHTSSNMWWDCLLSGHELTAEYSRGPTDEDKKMGEVIFETLCRILELESEECQGAALHGFGHLQHPSTEKTLRAWVNKHPELPEEDLEYVEACVIGEIM